MKIFIIIYCSFITLAVQPQSISGIYKALELNSLSVDTTGYLSFYGQDSLLTQKQFHEVEITIQGTKITIEKSPVYFDGNIKVYSASDGGFLTYKGMIIKNGDVYVAKTQLTNCDYIGMSYFTPPKIAGNDTSIFNQVNLNTGKALEIEKFEKFKSINGIIYLPKGTIRKDFIIRPTTEGIWVNNQLFYLVKKS